MSSKLKKWIDRYIFREISAAELVDKRERPTIQTNIPPEDMIKNLRDRSLSYENPYYASKQFRKSLYSFRDPNNNDEQAIRDRFEHLLVSNCRQMKSFLYLNEENLLFIVNQNTEIHELFQEIIGFLEANYPIKKIPSPPKSDYPKDIPTTVYMPLERSTRSRLQPYLLLLKKDIPLALDLSKEDPYVLQEFQETYERLLRFS